MRDNLRGLRLDTPAAAVFTRPIPIGSKPHARRRESHTDGFLYLIQNNRANHCKHDRSDAGGYETEHCHLLSQVAVHGRIARLAISSVCRCWTRLLAELPLACGRTLSVSSASSMRSMLETCVSP